MIDTDKYENWTDDFHVWEQYVKDIDYEPDRLQVKLDWPVNGLRHSTMKEL